MNSVTREINICAPREKVWSVLSDLGAVHKYSGGVQDSYYVSTNKSGIGAARKCDLSTGWVEERAIQWQDKRGYTLTIADGKGLGPIAQLEVAFELSDAGEDTKVRQTMSCDMKSGLLRPILNTLAGFQMRKAIDVNLSGLKVYVEREA